MKKMIVMLGVFFSYSIYAQNPFKDGINASNTIQYTDDASYTTITNARITSVEDPAVTYSYNYEWQDAINAGKMSYQVQWKWRDINAIKIDKDLFVLELDSDAMITETSTDMATHQTLTNTKTYEADIYFSSLEDAMNAAVWANAMVRNAGGHAEVL